MTIQEFVRNSLVQIYNGVSEARNQSGSIGGAVQALGKQEASCTFLDNQAGFLVDFDVAVTVSEKEGKDVGGGITIASFVSAGGKRAESTEKSTVSRIRFCVPITFQTPAELQAQTMKALGMPISR